MASSVGNTVTDEALTYRAPPRSVGTPDASPSFGCSVPQPTAKTTQPCIPPKLSHFYCTSVSFARSDIRSLCQILGGRGGAWARGRRGRGERGGRGARGGGGGRGREEGGGRAKGDCVRWGDRAIRSHRQRV